MILKVTKITIAQWPEDCEIRLAAIGDRRRQAGENVEVEVRRQLATAVLSVTEAEAKKVNLGDEYVLRPKGTMKEIPEA